MRLAILVLFSLFSLFSSAQSGFRNVASDMNSPAIITASPYDNYIAKQIANGNQATMDAGWVSVGKDSASTLLDIIANKNLVRLGTDKPIFDRDNGWLFTGSQGVFNTQFNPPKNKVVSDSNSLTYSVWVLEPGKDSDAGLFGMEVLSTTVKTFVFEQFSLNLLSYGVGSFGSVLHNSYILKHNTVISFRRINDSIFLFEDGTKLASVLDTPYEESKKNPYLGGLNQDGSVHPDTLAQQSHSRIGGAWISDENSNLDSLSANVKELYAAVFPWIGIDSIEVGIFANNIIRVHTKQTLYGTAWAIGDISFSVGGQTTATGISFVDGDKFVDVTTTGAVNSGADGTFSYTAGSNLITNSADNSFDNLVSVTISNNVGGDVVAPTVQSATINSATNINVIFSESVVNVSASRINFNFDGTSTDVIATAVGGSSSNYNFTFSADYKFGEVVNMDYSGGTVQDPSGNSLATIVDQSVANNLPDTALLTFPGAIGGGRYTTGGRGGNVYKVTNTNNSGVGSFRDAISQPNRFIVFYTGGIMTATYDITLDDLDNNMTIAGQTAPGGGFVIKKSQIHQRNYNVVVRGMTIRVGDQGYRNASNVIVKPELFGTSGERDAIAINTFDQDIFNVMWDHNTLMWSYDETMSATAGTAGTPNAMYNISMTYNMIAEPLSRSVHPEDEHSKGSLFNSGSVLSAEVYNFTVARNIYAMSVSRNPLLSGLSFPADDRRTYYESINNLNYNTGQRGTVTTPGAYSIIQGNRHKAGASTVNHGSGFIPGPYGTANRGIESRFIVNNFFGAGSTGGFWLWDNTGMGRLVGATPGVNEYDEVKTPKSGWSGFETDTVGIFACLNCPPKNEAVPFARITPLSDIWASTLVEDRLVAYAGSREDDAHNIRIKNHIIDSTGIVIDTQETVGSWGTVDAGTPWVDPDNDGIPTYFEVDYLGTDPNSSTPPDGSWDDHDGDGYGNIEEWANSFFDIVTVSNFYVNPFMATGTGDGSLGDPFTEAQALTQIQLNLSETFAFARGSTYSTITAAAIAGSGATFRSYGAGGTWPVYGSSGVWDDPGDIWTFIFD